MGAEDAGMEARIVHRVKEILMGSNLDTTTEKSIRRQLEQEIGIELREYKPLIRQEIQKYLEVEAVRLSQQSQEAAVKSESEKGEEANVEAKKRGGNSFGSILSPEMSAFVGESHMARTMVVKKLWEYIKGHNLQNPADRRKINLDSELSKLFKPPLTMLNMNKQLSRHCKVDDRAPPPQRGKKVVSSKNKVKKSARKIHKDAKKTGEKRKGGGGFGTVQLLGPLRSFMGADVASRTEVVKKVWAYIKEHNCKDPNDGRNIVPDSTLGQFLTAPVNMFNMNKQMSQYMQKSNPIN